MRGKSEISLLKILATKSFSALCSFNHYSIKKYIIIKITFKKYYYRLYIINYVSIDKYKCYMMIPLITIGGMHKEKVYSIRNIQSF